MFLICHLSLFVTQFFNKCYVVISVIDVMSSQIITASSIFKFRSTPALEHARFLVHIIRKHKQRSDNRVHMIVVG